MQLHLNLPVQIQLAKKLTLNKSIRQSYFTGILGNEIEKDSYNLLDILQDKKVGVTTTINGVDFTPQEDGGIKIKGTATNNADFYLTKNVYGSTEEIIELDTSSEYTIKLINKIKIDSQLIIGNGTTAYNELTSSIFTPTFNIAWCFIRIPAGVTFDKIVYPILYKGTEDKPYLPYGTTYKEESTGLQTIEVCNKNLFDKDNEQIEANIKKYHMNGSRLGNGEYTYLLIQNIKPNTKYTYAGAYNSSASNVIIFDMYKKDSYEKCSYFTQVERTFTTSENCTEMYVSIPYADKDTFMLVEGDEIPTTYTTHESQSYELDLGENTLGKHDYIYKYGINWYIFKFETDEDILIVDENLINQLENIKENIHLYDGTTHVAITSEKEPSIILDLSYYENK